MTQAMPDDLWRDFPKTGVGERSATDVVSSNHSPLLGLTWSKEFDGSLKGWTAEVNLGCESETTGGRLLPETG